METADKPDLIVPFRLSMGQAMALMTLLVTMVVSIVMGAFHFAKWNVEYAFDGIHREMDNQSLAINERVARIDGQLQEMKSGLDNSSKKIDIDRASSDVIKGDVGAVKDEVVQVKDEVVDVKGEVIEVKVKVDEMDSEIVDAGEKIKIVRSVLASAFKDSPEILLQLTDDRLSENLPIEFFGEEQRAGAALPSAGVENGGAPALPGGDESGGARVRTRSIVEHCEGKGGPVLECYRRQLEKYEARALEGR